MSYRKSRVFVLAFVSVIIWTVSQGMAAMGASEKDASVRKLGVAWNIAEDRKMENIGGIYEPEGLDKYMKRYFEEFSAKIDRLIEQSNRLEKKVDELNSKSSQWLASQQQKKN